MTYKSMKQILKENAWKGALVLGGLAALVAGSAVVGGCKAASGHTQEETDASWRRLLGFGYATGAGNPNLTPQQQAAAAAAGRAMSDTNRDNAIRDSGGTIIINNNGGNAPQYVQPVEENIKVATYSKWTDYNHNGAGDENEFSDQENPEFTTP